MSLFPTTVTDAATQQNFDELAQWLYTGNGSPENLVAAKVGALYMRQDGGAGTTLYVKESGGTGPTGWTAK